MTALLDVNMLLALLDAAHVHHDRAKAWLISESGLGWASCPITQSGFVRIISQPSYPNSISVSRAVSLLRGATESNFHTFWPDDLSLLDASAIDHSLVHGPKQITDVYLLALAVRQGGRFVALDRGIPLAAARKAEPRHLVLL